MSDSNHSLFDVTFDCLQLDDPHEKIQAVRDLNESWLTKQLNLSSFNSIKSIINPGRPEQPKLVDPRDVPRRGFNSELARVKLVHAITHIEFNAINLALDAVYRFRDMPDQYYTDWLITAVEEALHFSLLEEYLHDKDSFYGAYDAHNGLWEMAVKTDHDVMVRMALVPRVLEARGLDVTPGMISKLQTIGDKQLADILNIIQRDEIGHVAKGSYWFNQLCLQRGVSSEAMFQQLLDEYMTESIFDSLNEYDRLQAGFSKHELEQLAARNRRTDD